MNFGIGFLFELYTREEMPALRPVYWNTGENERLELLVLAIYRGVEICLRLSDAYGLTHSAFGLYGLFRVR